MYVPCSIIHTSHITLKRPSRAGTSSFLFCFTYFCFFIQFSRYTPGGGQFALCFVLIVLGVRGVPSTSLRFSPMVGSNGLEPSTSRLSGVRSNHLSYEPISVAVLVAITAYLFSFTPSVRYLNILRDDRSRLLAISRRGYVVRTRFVRELPPVQPVVEMNRIELSTPCLQGRCSPS